MTPQVYVLIAKRDASSTDALKVTYESREHALAAAAVLREYCPIVAVTVGDGSEVEGPHAKLFKSGLAQPFGGGNGVEGRMREEI